MARRRIPKKQLRRAKRIQRMPLSPGSARARVLLLFTPNRQLLSLAAQTFGAFGAKITALVSGVDDDAPVEIEQLHRQAIESAGSTSDDWRSINPHWFNSTPAEEYRAKLRQLLLTHVHAPTVYLLGDSQMGRFASLVVEAVRSLDIEVAAVLIVGDPRETMPQQDVPAATSALIWLRQICEAERATRDVPRLIVQSSAFANNRGDVVVRVGEQFGIEWPVPIDEAWRKLEAMPSIDLGNGIQTDRLAIAGMPEWVVAAHSILGKGRQSAVRREVSTRLDGIWERFDAAALAFGGILAENEVTLSDQLDELAELREERDNARAHVERSERALSELRLSANDAKALVEPARAESRRLMEQITERLAQIEALNALLAKTKAEFELRETQLNAEIESSRAKIVEQEKANHKLVEAIELAEVSGQRRAGEVTRLNEELVWVRTEVELNTQLKEYASEESRRLGEQVAALRMEVEQFESEKSQHARELESTRSYLREAQSDLQRIQGELDFAQRDQQEAQAKNEEQTIRLSAATSELTATQGAVFELQMQLESERTNALNATIAYEQALAKSEEVVRDYRSAAERKDAELQRVQEALVADDQQRQAAKSENEELAARLAAEIAATKGALVEVHAQLRTETERNQAMSRELEMVLAEAAGRKHRIESLNRQVATLMGLQDEERRLRLQAVATFESERSRADELAYAFKQAKSQTEVTQRVLDDRTQKLLVLEQELTSARAQVDAMNIALQEQKRDIETIKTSFVWRITHPRRELSAARSPASAKGTLKREARLIHRSGLFAKQWYVESNPDVAAEGWDPIVHYLRYGASEGRDPHPLFDSDWYAAQHPELTEAKVNPLLHYILEGRELNPNPLFDGAWYLRHYPDVAAAGTQPLVHYYEFGAWEGRDPNPLFDSSWYLQCNQDVAIARQNPLYHFLSHGAKEGRNPHPLFDTAWYLERNSDVVASNTNPLAHFIAYGAWEARDPHPLFDTDWYLRKNPDVAAAHDNALHHFMVHGASEGRNPHPLFDIGYYQKLYPDVEKSGMNALLHFLRYGSTDRLNPHPLFDAAYYLEAHPDVGNVNPLVHFLHSGAMEGYSPHPLFDVKFYLARYPDIAQSELNPLIHYVLIGGRKDYDPNPDFNSAWYRQQHPDIKWRSMTPLEHYLSVGIVQGAATRPPTAMPEAVAADLDEFAKVAVVPPPLQRLLSMYHGTDEVPQPLRVAFGMLARYGDKEVGAETLRNDPLISTFFTHIVNLARGECSGAVDASIIVPVHNKLIYTLTCLYTLLAQPIRAHLEIIIADDVSTDGTRAAFENMGGVVRYSRNQQNLGFIKNCNAAAKIARGDVVVLLNNDTFVLPNWLDELFDTLRGNPSIGLVGSKLINADGTLQEAGGIIWSDGAGWNFGRNEDACAPEFNYVKDVDYISGASIAVPRSLWEKLGGFDEIYAPAYYDDSDLAFRIRAANFRTVYQPFSALVHHEGVSHGRDVSVGIKSYQARNGKIFVERWQRTLAKENLPNGQDAIFARDRSRGRPRILIIDHYAPEPDRDAGSRTMFDYIRMFVNRGFQVTFWPHNLHFNGRYIHALQHLGVEVMYGWNETWPKFDYWLETAGRVLNYAYLIRPSVAREFVDKLRGKTSAKIFFNGTDIHFKRLEMEYDLTRSPSTKEEKEQMEALEKEIWAKCDSVYYLSDDEINAVHAEFPAKTGRVIPTFLYSISDLEQTRTDLQVRRIPNTKQLLFIGGFRHRPNVDAMLWFVKEVWPHIVFAVPDVRLVIAGSSPPNEIRALVSNQIKVTGAISEAELVELYRMTEISIVPLRYGAGVKGKLIEALRYAVPVVTTPTGIQGIAAVRELVSVADTPESFAEAVIDIIKNAEDYFARTQAGLDYVRRTSTESAAISILGNDAPELLSTVLTWPPS